MEHYPWITELQVLGPFSIKHAHKRKCSEDKLPTFRITLRGKKGAVYFLHNHILTWRAKSDLILLLNGSSIEDDTKMELLRELSYGQPNGSPRLSFFLSVRIPALHEAQKQLSFTFPRIFDTSCIKKFWWNSSSCIARILNPRIMLSVTFIYFHCWISRILWELRVLWIPCHILRYFLRSGQFLQSHWRSKGFSLCPFSVGLRIKCSIEDTIRLAKVIGYSISSFYDLWHAGQCTQPFDTPETLTKHF